MVCLLFSTRIFNFLQPLDSMGDPMPSNQSKLVASRVTNDWLFPHVLLRAPGDEPNGLDAVKYSAPTGNFRNSYCTLIATQILTALARDIRYPDSTEAKIASYRARGSCSTSRRKRHGAGRAIPQKIIRPRFRESS